MNILGLSQSKREARTLRASLALQETQSIHDSMNIPKVEFISEVKGQQTHHPTFINSHIFYLPPFWCGYVFYIT